MTVYVKSLKGLKGKIVGNDHIFTIGETDINTVMNVVNELEQNGYRVWKVEKQEDKVVLWAERRRRYLWRK